MQSSHWCSRGASSRVTEVNVTQPGDELYCLLVPLGEDRLLVPRGCISEVINYQAPTPMEGAPAWYRGTIAWGGRRVPLMSFEAACGRMAPRASGRTRIVVMQAIGKSLDCGHFAVLTQGFWVRRVGADPAVVGRTLVIDGGPTDVVGVMPVSFAFPRPQIDLWQPAQSTRASASFLFSIQGIARLRDDATVTSARAEITNLIEDLARRAPNQTGIVSTALPLHEFFVGRIAEALWILLAAVGLLLLVACANIANLFLVRSESRHREVAVRRALGAGTQRLARYFLAESVLLGAVGGILGLALAWGGVRLLVAFGPVNLPRLNEVRIDAVVVVFTAGLSLLAALAFGAGVLR